MATKKKKYSKRKMTLPLAVLAGFASPMARTFGHFQSYGFTGPEGAIAEFSRTMTGYNPYDNVQPFQFWRLRYGLYPVIAGLIVHKIAGFIGINKALSRAGVPLIRI